MITSPAFHLNFLLIVFLNISITPTSTRLFDCSPGEMAVGRVSPRAPPPFALLPHPSIPKSPGPVLVVVLDGWGEGPYNDEYNATHNAHTPFMDFLKTTAPQRWRLLKAHGTAVGLPSDADMGNSEVGHNALGAGQIVDQGAKCVDAALQSGSLFDSEGWRYIHAAAASPGATLHLLGLLSDGGVHSRYDQLMQLLSGALSQGVKKIRLHVLSDGRDVEDGTAVAWLRRMHEDLARVSAEAPGSDVKIASGGGRMKCIMDRYESDWSIVKRGWDAAVLGESPNRFVDVLEGVAALQAKDGGTSDQYIEPWVAIDPATKLPAGPIVDGDAVIIFNFRADRVVEICRAFEAPDNGSFTAFDRVRRPAVHFAGIMQYDGELRIPSHFLVPPPVIERVSEQYLVTGCGLRVFACSESQKIGHMTFFWLGNRGGTLDPEKETFVEMPSDQGISFDQKPEMKVRSTSRFLRAKLSPIYGFVNSHDHPAAFARSPQGTPPTDFKLVKTAREIAEAVKAAVASGRYDFVRCNFANADMVGHTGDLSAAVTACTTVDACLRDVIAAVEAAGGRWLVTADHGNAEDMAQRDAAGTPIQSAQNGGKVVPLTSHTLNPVPCAIGGAGLPEKVKFRGDLAGAGLANVTATYINLLGYEAPVFYEPSLIEVAEA